jgi:superfamily II DNA or RNA helicase
VEYPLWRESPTKIFVPKFYGLQRFGVPPPERITLKAGAPTSLDFTGQLRDEQRVPIEAFLKAARDPAVTGGILSLPCGFGKTVAALYLVHELKVRTMVVVHKDFLLNQWRERIEQFLPGASVGLIKAQTVDVEGKDIVLASLQSLSMKTYGDEVFEGIGFLIVDECHRIGTEVFSRALVRRAFPITLGISATVQRKDGMTKAFTYFLGDVLFKGKRREDTVAVVQASYWNPSREYRDEPMIGGQSPNISRMINNLTAFEERNQKIVAAIVKMLETTDGKRKVLVLSDRKRQLEAIHAGLVTKNVTAGFYWGGMKREALAETETKQVMCATFAYASEGMDVPALDTLVLASPKSDIEQSVGRILRQKPETREFTPMILDVVDEFSLFSRQGAKRAAFYKKHGYDVRRLTSTAQDWTQEVERAAIHIKPGTCSGGGGGGQHVEAPRDDRNAGAESGRAAAACLSNQEGWRMGEGVL